MTKTPYAGQRFAAFLFDMDGTILTSIAAAERVWAAWAQRHGLDVDQFLPTVHGRRAIDTVRDSGVIGIDPEAEAARITEDEIADVEGVKAIAGADRFLRGLDPKHWAIVTSAPRRLALRRIQAAGLPLPGHLITAQDIEIGKPAPDGYLLGARRLGVDPRQCLVFEDAAVGISSALSAGAKPLLVTATHIKPAGEHGIAASSTPVESASVPSITDYKGLSVAVDEMGMMQLI